MPDESTAQAINARLRLAMFQSGTTQQKVADHLGMSQASVSARLKGATGWRIDELERAAHLLGIALSDLVAAA